MPDAAARPGSVPWGHDGVDHDVFRRFLVFRGGDDARVTFAILLLPKFSLRHLVIRLSRNLRVRDLQERWFGCCKLTANAASALKMRGSREDPQKGGGATGKK